MGYSLPMVPEQTCKYLYWQGFPAIREVRLREPGASPDRERWLASAEYNAAMTTASPDYTSLRRIGWPWAGGAEAPAWQAPAAAHPGARPARVSEQHRTGYVLADGPDAGFRVESPPEWQRRPVFTADGVPLHERAAVGDWVLHDGRRIVALLPRRSAIKRAAAGEHYQQQVIAANVDTAFVVCGLDADFNPRRIERYLLLVGGGGVQPVIVLTKADRDGSDAAAALAALADLRAQGVPVLALNARDPAAVAALAPWLAPGMTAVLVGSSGAGKSTLTNSLLGEQRMAHLVVELLDRRVERGERDAEGIGRPRKVQIGVDDGGFLPIGQAPQALVYVSNAVPSGAGTDNLKPLANAAPVELPPSVKANKQFRCKDNSLFFVDYMSDDKTALLRTEKTGTPTKLTAPEAGQPFTAEGGFEVKGSGNDVTVTLPGKGAQACHV